MNSIGFGVKQRERLETKGDNPHILVMTATPIPRTMALSVYGDLDVSSIRHLPPGRQPVGTYAVGRNIAGAYLPVYEKGNEYGAPGIRGLPACGGK